MKVLKRDGIFLFLITFMYAGFHLLIPYMSSDGLIQKGLYVNHMLVYIPAVAFLASLVYGVKFGFKVRYPLYVFLLFPLTISHFLEWILLYQVAYTFFAFLGNAIGHIIYRLRK